MNYDSLDIITKLLTPIMIMFLGMYFFMFYRKDKQHQRKLEEERFLMERERLESNKVNIDINSKTEDNTPLGFGSGGFIILDIPENQRGLFHDLLRGFEDFAKLKGYSISFSVDNSLSEKIGFKFTINDSGISVSTQKVRQDIKEYLYKVKNGDNLEELPILTTQEEHSLILTQLLNRLSFLQHNYNLQKNSIKFYENLIEKLSTNNGITTQPSILVQTGGLNQPQNYLATNSPGAIQGTNIQDINSSITIADSFKNRENQINQIIELINLTKKDDNNQDSSKIIIKNLNKIKEELEDEEKPDKSRIEKWLKSVRSCFENSKFTKETTLTGNSVFDSFNL